MAPPMPPIPPATRLHQMQGSTMPTDDQGQEPPQEPSMAGATAGADDQGQEPSDDPMPRTNQPPNISLPCPVWRCRRPRRSLDCGWCSHHCPRSTRGRTTADYMTHRLFDLADLCTVHWNFPFRCTKPEKWCLNKHPCEWPFCSMDRCGDCCDDFRCPHHMTNKPNKPRTTNRRRGECTERRWWHWWH